MKKFTKMFPVVLIIILILGNIYFINKSHKSDFEIQVWFPAETSDNNQFHSLEEKSDIDTIIFALIHSHSAPNTSVEDLLPDARILINDKNETQFFCYASLWLLEDSILFKLDTENTSEFKEISNAYFVKELKNIFETPGASKN